MSGRASGIGFVPQGREIFPLLTVEENLKTGFGPLKREDRNIPDDVFSLFPVLQLDAGAPRRRPVRRPAAAARDRPRAGDAAETAAARRADRGHPALDHQGHRARDLLSAQPRQHRDRAGRTISRLCLRARRQFRRHGPGRGEICLRSQRTSIPPKSAARWRCKSATRPARSQAVWGDADRYHAARLRRFSRPTAPGAR